MLTTSWAALREHTASEQYTGHVLTSAGASRSVRAAGAGCGHPTAGTEAEPTTGTAHALALGTTLSASSVL